MTSSENDLLNWAQRNSVSIMLRRLEITLRHAPDDLTNREQGVLYEYQPSVSGEMLQRIQQEIALVLQDIDDLTDHLRLSRWTQPNTAVLLSELAVLWSDLNDIRVDKLTRYGEVSPDLDAVLSPALIRLIHRVETMMRLLSKEKGDAQVEQ